jgi:G3E family GTPase
MQEKARIPVTVLTGFLGAGKTTLLNAILLQNHGYKCAIVINEFGAISIDHQLVIGVDEEILELNNGCICCRVRGDLVKSLGELLRKQKRFDYVLIETTGLADPGPVAGTFRTTDLAERLRLDSIVTVADARHLEKELDDAPEASAQLAFADVVLLNKTDLVSEADLERVEQRIRKINAVAKIRRTERAQVPVAELLNIKAHELKTAFVLPDPPSVGSFGGQGEHEHDHDHAHEEGHHHHHHDDAVRSFFIVDERPLDLRKLEDWLTGVIKEMGPKIYRSKGILHVAGQPKRIVFQGVQMLFDAAPDRFWNIGEKRLNQLVFIGKDLDEAALRAGFEGCIAHERS